MARPDGAPVQIRQATTGPAGVALINNTQTVLTWTAPSDGLTHIVEVFAWKRVATSETGGAVFVKITEQGGSIVQSGTALFAGGQANADYPFPGGLTQFMVNAGAIVEIDQTSALSGGASTVFAEIWAS